MSKYEATQKSVQFVPPDGEFELMRCAFGVSKCACSSIDAEDVPCFSDP